MEITSSPNFDLQDAYNLIRILEGDKLKTAFITLSIHYEYWVMPFGLSNSSSVSQGYMNKVSLEFLYRFVIIYIDNIFR